MWLLLIFIVVPLIEIGLFIQVGGWIGLWPTLAMILAMAFLGAWLVRREGARAFLDLRQSMTDLRDPTESMAHGALILFAGVLLITPGFFTDAMGLALLIRPVRSLAVRVIGQRFRIVQMGAAAPGRAATPDDDVIDAEYTELGGKPLDGPRSGWTRH